MLSPYEFNPFNVNPLRDILEKCVDFERVQASKELKIFISATNVRTCKIQVFENKTFTLDAVMASACLPYLFQSVEVEGEYYWDGGFMGNPALYPIFYNCDSKDILILHINPICREKIPKTAAEILNRMNEISFNSSLMREMRVISFVNKLLDNNWITDERKKTMKRLFMHAIRADVTMQSLSVASKMNAEWSFINDLHHRGRIESEEWLKNNFRLIGKQSSIDIEEYL
jgi:NTE family protein